MGGIEDMTPDELAKACADVMWEGDRNSQALGMKILTIFTGEAVLGMRVRDDMTNGHGICHGGMIFSLADSAFAFACNGYNQITVAGGCSIEFLAPAYKGDQLTAKAKERQRSARSGIYDVSVTNQDGLLIAEFRGKSRTIKGTHLS